MSPSERTLQMGERLAEFHRQFRSPEGDRYLANWPAERAELLRELAAADGRTVEMRHAMRAYRRQKAKVRKQVENFKVLGIVPEATDELKGHHDA